MILDDKLRNQEIIVLDGAVGSEIERFGGLMSSSAWCGVANKTHPEVVRRVHEEYIRAGADVVTTNTFTTNRHVLAAAGLADETVSITTRAVELAREAVNNVSPNRPIAVAGSMSNMSAWIPGTVSSDPRFLPTPEEELENYREQAQTLAAAGVDLILMEMMTDTEQSSRVITAAMETGLPVWIGTSCSLLSDGSLSAWNQRMEEPADRLSPDRVETSYINKKSRSYASLIETMMSFNPQVMGVMHSTVENTDPGITALFEQWNGPVMVYPESSSMQARIGVAHEIEPAAFAAHCRDWVERGVQIIGGCCGTTIEHIRAMVNELPDTIGDRR
ncbi:homocysteine S-methyltransferase family protein [Dehalococcoidia bacterium]|nr:homocysteine S-methyltransferase family protein [Dehalococcoidia bacterium]